MSANSPTKEDDITPYPGYLHDVQSSKPAYLLDILNGTTENLSAVVIDDDDDDEVEVIGEINTINFLHYRGDCLKHPFAKDPLLFCEKCACFACKGELAADCKVWSTHCHVVYEKKTNPVVTASDQVESIVNINETDLVVVPEDKTIDVDCEGGQLQRAKAEANLAVVVQQDQRDLLAALKTAFKEYLSLTPDQLKSICDDKGIVLVGHRTLPRDRFIVALVRHFAEAD